MKYFKELSNIESGLIELQTLKSLVTVMTNGVEGSTMEDITNSLFVIEKKLADLSSSMYGDFNVLWDRVRDGE